MSRGDRSDKIPELVIKGIRSAFRRYQRWSLGEKWLHHAPELFVSVEIAHRVMEGLSNCRVDMEASVRQALQSAGAKRRGAPKKAQRTNGRYDILVSRKSGLPWCAIEVKSPVWGVSKGLVDDMERIANVISHRSHSSSLSCGAVAFYCDCAIPKRKHPSARAALASLAAQAEARATEICKRFDGMRVEMHKSPFFAGDDGDGWQAFCLFFRMRRSRRSIVVDGPA